MLRLLLVAAALAVATVGAQAQATRTWVSGVGDDVNPCSRTAPCKTFAGAISKTAAGGIINNLDPGGFGAVTVTKSITLEGGGSLAHILNTSTTGVIVNSAGGRVNIRDLTISGSTGTNSGLHGIRFLNGDALVVEDTTIEGQVNTAGGNGVSFTPSGAASLTLRNVKFSDASSGAGAAIRIATTGQSLNISLENVQISGGATGLLIDTTGGGFVRVSVKNSTFTNISGDAIAATAGSGKIRLYIDNVTLTTNGNAIVANGANVIGWMGETTIAGNNIGVKRDGGANLMSFKNNYIYNNNTDGIPLPNTWNPPAVVAPAPSPAPSTTGLVFKR